jgi:hypothetical protein
MKKVLSLTVLTVALLAISCSRKGNDNPAARLGDLHVEFEVTDQYSQLTDIIPVSVTLFEDSLHTFQIDSKRITTAPDVVQSVDFKDINARSSVYYLQLKFDYNSDLDAACPDFPVYIQEGIVRQETLIVLEYKFTGLDCHLD